MKLPKHPEEWMDYIRWWVRNNGIEGRVAVLSEGPSMNTGEGTTAWKSSISTVESEQENMRMIANPPKEESWT